MKNKLLWLLLVLVIVLPISVNGLCTSKKQSNLKSIAYKTELSYELKFDSEHNYYFEVSVTNMNKDVILIYNGVVYESKGEDDVIVIDNKLEGGATYEFNLYGGYDTACVEEYLYTKKLSIPKYNVYSERDECIEYEEFYLCNKWYPGTIGNDEFFESELNNYIESLNAKEEEEKEEVIEKGLFEKIIDFYIDNIIITLPLTILIVGVVIFMVVRNSIRRKNRIKLDS